MASNTTQTRHSLPTFEATAWLAAIVDNTDDAIVSKTLDGIITSWNAGAAQLFGFTADEAVGQPVTLIIPDDRLHEEESILQRLRAGERIEHFETVRRRKDGALINVSLTVSPVRNAKGEILGASKIARDITHQMQAQEKQTLLLQEMRHRVKNLFALTKGLIAMSAREARTPGELAESLSGRLMALASAHDLTLAGEAEGPDVAANIRGLLEAILAPYKDRSRPDRIEISGEDFRLQRSGLTPIALVLHELATNSAKYGALANRDGELEIVLARSSEGGLISWQEAGVRIQGKPEQSGFGSHLGDSALAGLGGNIERRWSPDGLSVAITVPAAHLTAL